MRRNSAVRASMCRLDVESAVKEVGQSIGDVLSSPRYVLGRGVKRKLVDCEDPVPDLPYPLQRQLVMDLCLDKLQSCHRRSEPSLHRSVLLANTLRQLQQEMRQEGGGLSPTLAAACPAHAAPATPRHTPDLPPVPSDCVLAEEALPSLTSCHDLIFGSFEITNSTSYLTDLAPDDIFDDIDTSMYDPSDFSVLAFPSLRVGSGAPSTNGEEGLKTFSSCSPSSALQHRLSDLNDLDQIMEILVRS
ncbi:SERTA domain-containing protein 2 isoform X2 [Denticeps clupeoides]|nr:SERTA domain-containing protein 2-like isoform X2 [Denticeps clupeoides]